MNCTEGGWEQSGGAMLGEVSLHLTIGNRGNKSRMFLVDSAAIVMLMCGRRRCVPQ